MEKFAFSDLPTGQVLGKAVLVNVKKYKNSEEFNNDKDKHLASEAYGKYGFILSDIKRIKPFGYNGKLGFWNCDIII